VKRTRASYFRRTVVGIGVAIACLVLLPRLEATVLFREHSNPDDVARYRAELERGSPTLATLKLSTATAAPDLRHRGECKADDSGDFSGQPDLVLNWPIAPTGQAPVIAAGAELDAGLRRLGWQSVPVGSDYFAPHSEFTRKIGGRQYHAEVGYGFPDSVYIILWMEGGGPCKPGMIFTLPEARDE